MLLFLLPLNVVYFLLLVIMFLLSVLSPFRLFLVVFLHVFEMLPLLPSTTSLGKLTPSLACSAICRLLTL